MSIILRPVSTSDFLAMPGTAESSPHGPYVHTASPPLHTEPTSTPEPAKAAEPVGEPSVTISLRLLIDLIDTRSELKKKTAHLEKRSSTLKKISADLKLRSNRQRLHITKLKRVARFLLGRKDGDGIRSVHGRDKKRMLARILRSVEGCCNFNNGETHSANSAKRYVYSTCCGLDLHAVARKRRCGLMGIL